MGTLVSLLFAAVVTAAIGGGVMFYLQRVRLPREEGAEGIAALAAMRWRDFIRLVLDVLAHRGYARVNDPEASSDEADIPLERNGELWLLSSKHGASYMLDSGDIAEFASAMRMRGAVGGLLVTPGNFAPVARRLAEPQRIELLDGPTLWPELRERMPEAQRTTFGARAHTRAREHTLLGWLAAAVAGIAVFLSVHGSDGSAPVEAHAVAETAPAAVQSAPASTTHVAPAPQATLDVEPAPRDVDPATLEKHRNDAARAIGSLPMVDRALWQTSSTLLVYLSGSEREAKPAICPLLERYPELGASRVQLQPPPGSGMPVRFFQCRSY